MSDEVVSEIIQLMTFVSQDDIRTALEKALKYKMKETLQAAFRSPSPSPKVSSRPVAKAAAHRDSPSIKLHRFTSTIKSTEMPDHPVVRRFLHHQTHEEGATAGFEVHSPLKSPFDMVTEPKSTVASLWKRARYNAQAEDGAFDILKTTTTTTMTSGLGAAQARMDVLMEAAEKCGVPKTRTDMLAKNGSIENVIKAAMTRQGVQDAVLGGAWQGAALTAAFDVTRLFDGDFKSYLANIGLSGLRGGGVAGLSSWIHDPFFGNGAVLGVVVGSAFGAASLASTGDWARFGKGLGCNLVGATTAWGGATAGAALGSLFGPVGTAVGGLVGGMCGGVAGRQVSARVPSLGGKTGPETAKAAGAIRQQLAAAGLEPDRGLSAEQIVAAAMAKGAGHGQAALQVRMTDAMAARVTDLRELLVDLHQVSPGVLFESRDILRAVRSSI